MTTGGNPRRAAGGPEQIDRSSRRGPGLAKLLVAMLVAVGMLSATSSAGAMPTTPAFEGNFRTAAFNVNGTFQAMPLLCGDQLDIFWYAPGAAQDFIWTSVDISGPTMTYGNLSRTVNGSFSPLTGDFDGDGCEDIFWYAPGVSTDHVWYNNGNGNFTSKAVNVGGHYRPVVNFFNADETDDIYWYAPGTAAESMWIGNTNRTFTSVAAPAVNGDYVPVPFMSGGVLWYGPGNAPDVITAVEAGVRSPVVSLPTYLPQVAQPVSMFVTPLMYRPGPLDEAILVDVAVSGSTAVLFGFTGNINGTYRIRGSAAAPIAVLHAPGPAADQLMFTPSSSAGASEDLVASAAAEPRPPRLADVLAGRD